MQEKWEPINGLNGEYNIDNIELTDKGGLRITFSEYHNIGKKVLVSFEHGVLAHNEHIRKLVINDSSKKWTFFKKTDSSYLKWLSEQSFGLSDFYKVTHYSFIAENIILDVVNTYEPIVVFID